MPTLSVVIPSYMPAERYVRECFAGLESQTFQDFEVVIVDESDEATAAFLASIPTSFPKRVIRPSGKLGLSRSLNLGIQSCDAPFVARHDIDDICDPERFARQMAFLAEHPEISAVGSWVQKIGSDGEDLGLRKYPVTPADVRRHSGFWNPFCHSSVILRRNFFDLYGLYSDSDVEDHELWLRALHGGARMANIPAPLIRYRIESTVGYSRPRHYKESFRIRWHYLSWDHLPIRIASLLLAGIAIITPHWLFRAPYKLFNRVR